VTLQGPPASPPFLNEKEEVWNGRRALALYSNEAAPALWEGNAADDRTNHVSLVPPNIYGAA
jgi:hypothetical protein